MMFTLRICFILVCCCVTSPSLADDFLLTSSTIDPDKGLSDRQVYGGFGCSGKNISPALTWTGAPEDAKTFAVTVYDPDAPTGSGWWHWIVYNIAPHVKGIVEGAGDEDGWLLPPGATQGRSDYGSYSFGGACPPLGDEEHNYVFTVHALKIAKIDVPQDASAAMLGYMIHANSIGKASFTTTYRR